MFKKIFKYIEPAWLGNDGKFSVRSALAIAFSIHLMIIISYAVKRWEVGKSLEGLALVLSIEAGLVAGLLVLKTYQNSVYKQPLDSNSSMIEEVKTEEVK